MHMEFAIVINFKYLCKLTQIKQTQSTMNKYILSEELKVTAISENL